MKKTAVITLPDNYGSVGVYTYSFKEIPRDKPLVLHIMIRRLSWWVTVLQGRMAGSV